MTTNLLGTTWRRRSDGWVGLVFNVTDGIRLAEEPAQPMLHSIASGTPAVVHCRVADAAELHHDWEEVRRGWVPVASSPESHATTPPPVVEHPTPWKWENSDYSAQHEIDRDAVRAHGLVDANGKRILSGGEGARIEFSSAYARKVVVFAPLMEALLRDVARTVEDGFGTLDLDRKVFDAARELLAKLDAARSREP